MSGTPPIPERLDSLGVDQGQFIPPALDYDARAGQADARDDSPSFEPVTVEYETPDFFRDTYKTLNMFLENGELCDVEIQCGSKSFKCHRIILASISGYFRAMFMGALAESKQNVVKIQDIDENVMEDMVKYAYSGKIRINVDTVQSILYVASILQIENVARACSDFMKEHLHPENCVQVHAFAIQHNREQLIKYSQDFITENFLEVAKMPEYLSMSPLVIDTIVGSSNLNISNEIEVFEAVMLWINHDKENRKQHLPSLMSKIKLPLVNTSYLMDKIASNELVRTNLGCRDYMDEAKNYQMYQANLVTDIKITERMRPRKSYSGMLSVLVMLVS